MIVSSATEFGALVRSERRKRRWSQKKLAERAGVSPLWISQFERGKPTAHIGLVLRTLKTLDVKLWAGNGPSAVPQAKETVVDLDKLLEQQTESILIHEEGRIEIDPHLSEE